MRNGLHIENIAGDGTNGIEYYLRVGLDSCIDVPVYWLGAVPENNCARYAKRVARDLFGRSYESPCHAWELKYYHDILRVSDPLRDLRSYQERGLFAPGNLVGVKRKRSKFKDVRDSRGLTPNYTHVAVFIGNKDRKFVFAEQVGRDCIVSTLGSMIARGDSIVEVLIPS